MNRNKAIQPSRMVFYLLVVSAAYPLVTGLFYLMQAIGGDWAIWKRNVVVVPIIVGAIMFIIVPLTQKLLSRRRV